MSKLKLAYKTLLDDVSVVTFTTGSEDASYPVENCYDGNLYTYMNIASSASVYQIDFTLNASAGADYFAFYKHNLADLGGSISLLYHDGSGYVNAFENYLPYSENFSAWNIQSSATVTANQAYAPDGTLTADLIDLSGSVNARVSSGSTDVPQNTDMYAYVWLRAPDGESGTWPVAAYNGQAVESEQLVTLTDQWQKIVITFTSYNGAYSSGPGIYVGNRRDEPSTSTLTQAYAWGAYSATHQGQTYFRTNGTVNAIAPKDGRPILVSFPEVSSHDWRIEVDNGDNGAATISDIKFGKMITTEYGDYIGSTPLPLARFVEFDDNKSDGGLPLGRSVRYMGFKTTINIEFMTEQYSRGDWLNFIEHAETDAFYFVPNITDYEFECAYAVTDGRIDMPTRTHNNRMSVALKVTGYLS